MDRRCAILLRGHAKRMERDYAQAFDFTKTWPNIEHQLIKPFRRDTETDLFLALQSSDLDQQVAASLNPHSHVFLDHAVSQFAGYLEGLRLIQGAGVQYDFVVASRLDLLFKTAVTDFLPDLKKFNFCWTEPNPWQLVCDVVHIFSYSYLEPFIKVLEIVKDSEFLDRCVGQLLIRRIVDAMIGTENVNFLVKERFFSGTDGDSPAHRNPMYIIFGPRYVFDDFPPPIETAPRATVS
jgi:hypothetical protein